MGARRRFVQMYGEIVLGVPAERFDEDAHDLDAPDLERLTARYAAITEEEAGEPIPTLRSSSGVRSQIDHRTPDPALAVE